MLAVSKPFEPPNAQLAISWKHVHALSSLKMVDNGTRMSRPAFSVMLDFSCTYFLHVNGNIAILEPLMAVQCSSEVSKV
jgi:hypothetical protein